MAKCADRPTDVSISEKSVLSTVTVHDLTIWLSALFTIGGSIITAYLVLGHAANYTRPKQQKQIIRILLIVPIFSLCFTLGTVFYRSNVYFTSAYEAYESVALIAFFLLLCQYIQPDITCLQNYFAAIETKPWIIVVRFFMVHFSKNKSGFTADGRKWLKIIWVGVVQFLVVKILIAVLKCITEATGVYCDHDKGAEHANIWLMVFGIFSIAGAMLCLVQFFYQSSEILAPHQAVLKFLAIKLVVIVFYTEEFIFDQLLADDGPVSPSETISYPSWSVGIPNALFAFQMALLAIMHIWAYPFDVYKPSVVAKLDTRTSRPSEVHVVDTECYGSSGTGDGADIRTEISQGGLFGWRAIVDALNPMDMPKHKIYEPERCGISCDADDLAVDGDRVGDCFMKRRSSKISKG